MSPASRANVVLLLIVFVSGESFFKCLFCLPTGEELSFLDTWVFLNIWNGGEGLKTHQL